MGFLLITAVFVGLSASAQQPEAGLRDPFVERATLPMPRSELRDPFARPRPTRAATPALTDPFATVAAKPVTQVPVVAPADPFSPADPDYGLRDPFEAPAPASDATPGLSDPFDAPRPSDAPPVQRPSQLHDPFGRAQT